MAFCASTAKDIAATIISAPVGELEALVERYADDPRKQVVSAVKAAKKRIERERALHENTASLYAFERELGGEGAIIGVDEVGRGPVAGPLTVAAVCLPKEPLIIGINDSKQLSAPRREALAEQIHALALGVGIVHVEPATIDALGMSMCLRKAMADAVEACGLAPDCVLIDGNPVHAHPLEKTVVKGDARCASIAAASIVAKVARDALMIEYDAVYPEYGFAKNKGYASAEHIDAIKRLGLSPIHRLSFCGNFLETPTLF